MSTLLEQIAFAVLRDRPDRAVPLDRLHHEVLAELGDGAVTYDRLRDRLAHRPDLFLVLEPGDPFDGGEYWTPELRARYRQALRAARADATYVALAPATVAHEAVEPEADAAAGGAAAAIRAVERSLVALWAERRDDPATRAGLEDAVRRLDEMRRTLTAPAGAAPAAPSTTPLPGPRP